MSTVQPDLALTQMTRIRAGRFLELCGAASRDVTCAVTHCSTLRDKRAAFMVAPQPLKGREIFSFEGCRLFAQVLAFGRASARSVRSRCGGTARRRGEAVAAAAHFL